MRIVLKPATPSNGYTVDGAYRMLDYKQRLEASKALCTWVRDTRLADKEGRVYKHATRSNADWTQLYHTLRASRATLKDRRVVFTIERRIGNKTLSVSNTTPPNDAVPRRRMLASLRNSVREFRSAQRNVCIQYRGVRLASGGRTEIEHVGGVHTEAGSILGLRKVIKRGIIEASKAPKSAVKHVGVELEFCSPNDADTITDALIEAGLEEYVQLKTDGSVRPDQADACECACGECDACDNGDRCDGCECRRTGHGHELCIIAPQQRIKRVVVDVCAVLNSQGAYVNKTCGMHVHLDVRTRDASKVFARLVAAYPLLASLVPKARRNNSYCLPNEARETRAYTERYHAVNPQSIRRHQTVEVRLHSGTTNAVKITKWIQLLVKISDAPIDVDYSNAVRTIDDLAKYTPISARLREYVEARVAKFTKSKSTKLNENAA